MFGKQRSSIPTPGSKTGVPSKRTTQTNSPTGRTSQAAGTSSGIPVASKNNGTKNSTTELPKDPKLLNEMVVNLQKQLQEKDDTLRDLNVKLSRKSEECDSLMEERDTMRSKNSFALQQVTEDQDALQETLKKKDKYILEMEGRYRGETRKLKNEIEELTSEHEIEMEMLRKEMEDLKLREERWKKAAELRKESDYDSSDVGSRDHSPEVEALKEKMATIHSNYEDEIAGLKEKLQSQIIKANEATEKAENQEFEFEEKVSEIKSAFESEKQELELAHQVKINSLRSGGLENSAGLDADQKESYENLVQQLEEQVLNLNAQLQEERTQMAQDLLTVKNEFEKQLEEAKCGLESEKENLQRTILELKTEAEEIDTKHSKDIEQMEQVLTRKKEEILNNGEEERNFEAIKRKLQEYENEIKELKETLLNERGEFNESRAMLESTISEQEKDFDEKEEKLREELREECEKKMEKVVSNYEQRLKEAERRHLEDKDLDEEKRSVEELQLEMKAMERTHEREIDGLNENLDSLREENENLKREFDLVVTDLSSELETTKKSEMLSVPSRKTSSVLREQIEIIKANQDEQIRQLGKDIESYKQRVIELESELQRQRSAEEKKYTDMDLQTRTVELKYELDVLREESQKKETELEECRKAVSELEKELAHCKISQDQKQVENDICEISVLQEQLDSAMKEKANLVAETEEQRANVGSLRKQLGEVNDTRQRLELENMRYSGQLQMLTEECHSKGAKTESMQEMINHLEDEKRSLQDTIEKNSQETEIKIEELNKIIEKTEQEKTTAIGAEKAKSEEITLGLNDKIEQLLIENETAKIEKNALIREVEEFQAKEDEKHGIISQHKGKIEEMFSTIKSLEDIQRQSEIEKANLQEEIENLRCSQEVAEPLVSMAAVDENFASNPATVNLEYEQQMKGLAEDYEEKIGKLQAELENARGKLASNSKRMESVNVEIKTLSENLEQERFTVKNAQERMLNMQERYNEELKSLKEQLQVEKKKNMTSEDEDVKNELLKTTKTLEADLEIALQANNDLTKEMADLKLQLEKAWRTNETQEREISQLTSEAEELRLKQEQHEGRSSEEHPMARDVHAKTIQVLKADIESARRLNQSQEEEIRGLRQELDDLQQQQIAHEANLTAEHFKTRDQQNKKLELLKADVDAAHLLNKTQEEKIYKLQQELEDSEQSKTTLEDNLTEKQIQLREIEEKHNIEIERKSKEITSLKEKLEMAQETNRMQCQELLTIKHDFGELQNSQERYEKNLAGEQIRVDEATARRVRELEEEVKRKTEEMTKLFGVLDTEQKGRERVLLETERRLTQMHQAEQEKINSERTITELRKKNAELRGELIKEKEKFENFVLQSERAQLEEHEEVENLSRSLTESEMDKGILTKEVDSCREELNKVIEKYNKLKEKFGTLKQKRKEEKEKLDAIFLTPRSEMGLQTNLLEPEDIIETKEQLSSSMREQVRLEDALEILQRDMYKRTTEIQALKRANDVLRRQNQVLYLETESLRSLGHIEGVDVSKIQKFNEKLLQEKENLEIENRFLKEALSDNEKQDHEAQEKESFSNEMKELEELKETREQLTLENEKLRDENDFLVKQGKRLQSQVDRLEEDNERLRNATSVTPRTGNYRQSQALVNEVIQSEAEIQLNMESSPGFHRGEVPSRTVAAQRFDEENQRIREQLRVLQSRLNAKEIELQGISNSQTEEVEDLVNEKEALIAQMELLKKALEKYEVKGLTETNEAARSDAHTTNESFQPTSLTPSVGEIPFTGFHNANPQKIEFSVDNYLGSAYWEASKFLDRLQQVN